LQLELSCIPHAQQRYIFDWLSKQLKRLECVAIDATGNGEALAEHAADKLGSSDSGGPVHQIKISNAWYNENLPVFKAALEDGEYSIPADNNTIDDLRALQVIDGIPKLPKVTGQTGRHGDAAIAHALAHFASRQDCNHYAWHGLNQNPSVARDPLAKRANRDRRNRHATKHQKGLL
jgi:phage FluMu gp28-like protein